MINSPDDEEDPSSVGVVFSPTKPVTGVTASTSDDVGTAVGEASVVACATTSAVSVAAGAVVGVASVSLAAVAVAPSSPAGVGVSVGRLVETAVGVVAPSAVLVADATAVADGDAIAVPPDSGVGVNVAVVVETGVPSSAVAVVVGVAATGVGVSVASGVGVDVGAGVLTGVMDSGVFVGVGEPGWALPTNTVAPVVDNNGKPLPSVPISRTPDTKGNARSDSPSVLPVRKISASTPRPLGPDSAPRVKAAYVSLPGSVSIQGAAVVWRSVLPRKSPSFTLSTATTSGSKDILIWKAPRSSTSFTMTFTMNSSATSTCISTGERFRVAPWAS